VDDPGERDRRQDEPWFGRLPAAEQQRLRASWHEKRHRFDHEWRRNCRRLWRATCHGGLLFLVVALVQSVFVGLGPLLPMAAAGALAGLVGQACGGGRFALGIAGTIAYLVVMGPGLLINPFGLICALLVAHGMGVLGLQREMEQSGGFDARRGGGDGPGDRQSGSPAQGRRPGSDREISGRR